MARNRSGRLQPAKLGSISFDALISFDRTLEADIPDYPVELGYSVQDTIILKPVYINVTAYLTNTPVTFGGRASKSRVEQIAQALTSLYERKQLTTFTCSKGVYRSMGIESLSLPYDSETKGAMEVSFKLKQVRTTSSTTVAIPGSYGKGGATGANAGTASTNTGGSGSGSAGGSSGSGGSGNSSSQKSASILYGMTMGGKK